VGIFRDPVSRERANQEGRARNLTSESEERECEDVPLRRRWGVTEIVRAGENSLQRGGEGSWPSTTEASPDALMGDVVL